MKQYILKNNGSTVYSPPFVTETENSAVFDPKMRGVRQLQSGSSSLGDFLLPQDGPDYISLKSLSSSLQSTDLHAAQFYNLYRVIYRMASLPEGTDQAIDQETKDDASQLLGYLTLYDIPPPQIFSHGGDAVVFAWDGEKVTRYLTVSDGELGVLDVKNDTLVECSYPQLPMRSSVLDRYLEKFPQLAREKHAAE